LRSADLAVDSVAGVLLFPDVFYCSTSQNCTLFTFLCFIIYLTKKNNISTRAKKKKQSSIIIMIILPTCTAGSGM